MGLDIEAVYEGGLLKLPRELPLVDGAIVNITIHPPKQAGAIKHVIVPCASSHKELERWLNDLDEGQWGPRDV
jgi:predicted DNA-binding antitoxin AbrB/MazE fold protein